MIQRRHNDNEKFKLKLAELLRAVEQISGYAARFVRVIAKDYFQKEKKNIKIETLLEHLGKLTSNLLAFPDPSQPDTAWSAKNKLNVAEKLVGCISRSASGQGGGLKIVLEKKKREYKRAWSWPKRALVAVASFIFRYVAKRNMEEVFVKNCAEKTANAIKNKNKPVDEFMHTSRKGILINHPNPGKVAIGIVTRGGGSSDCQAEQYGDIFQFDHDDNPPSSPQPIDQSLNDAVIPPPPWPLRRHSLFGGLSRQNKPEGTPDIMVVARAYRRQPGL